MNLGNRIVQNRNDAHLGLSTEFSLNTAKMSISSRKQTVKPINYNNDFKKDRIPNKNISNVKTVIKSENNTKNNPKKISDSEYMEWNNENSTENNNPQLETGRKEKVLIDKNGTISETNN